MITEIFVENKKLDINADISSLITFAIDDIKDFASRSTAFSKTVVLPGTANNNAIFGNIFETGRSNSYNPAAVNIGYNFNPAIAARCIVFQDNLQTFKGTLRLLEVIHDKGSIEYEVALNGELTSLNVSLSAGYLSDLDFSAHNLDWNVTNIVASWDNTPGSGVYFPLMDFGTYSADKHNWDFRTFRPALYVKEYIDKIFAAANFRYSCALFNTDRFKRLVIPHNQQQLTKLSNEVFEAIYFSLPPYQHIIDYDMSVDDEKVFFNDITAGLFTVVAGKTFTYTGTTILSTTLTIHLEGYYNFEHPDPDSHNYTVTMVFRKNGVDYYELGPDLDQMAGVDIPYTRDVAIPITLAPGDSFYLYYYLLIDFQTGGFGSCDVYVAEASMSITSSSMVTSPVDYDETINLSFALPQNIRQVDFILSIVKLFNLYVYESKFDERLINITPYVDFYDTGSDSTVDWTYKLNRDAPIKIKPLSEINSKIYNFNYKDDSDYFNDLYKKRYNLAYGSHVFDSEFEFASQTNKLDLIFASTPLVGYDGEDKIYSTIFKRTGDVSGAGEEKIDSVIRILQTKKITGLTSFNIKNGATVLGAYTSYGYAGHFDDPNNPDNDLNFGVTQEVFFTLTGGDLTKTQFNIYWSAYMAEMTDKDSKLVVAKFYLAPADIFSLDFGKYVYVEGSLFRLNKIIDYNATIPSDAVVELLKVINTSYSFPVGEVAEDNIWIDADGVAVADSDNEEILYI